MKKVLKRIPSGEIYYFANGEKVFGKPSGVSGDLSGVRGNLSRV